MSVIRTTVTTDPMRTEFPYCRLTEGYCLRGWQKANGLLVKRPDNETEELLAEELFVLMLCDGRTDFSVLPSDPGQEKILSKWEERGVISWSRTPDPIDDDQKYRFYDNRYVRKVFWSITGRCNYRCRHCYMDAPAAKMGELPHEDMVRIIDQMDECGVLACDLTGGEALVREDFWDLVDRLRDKKIHIGTIYSNGLLVNDVLLDGFEKRNMRPEISISFDGFGWHDWLRGVPGAEKAALDALRRCQERSFPTDVQMCVHKGNKDGVRETVNRLAKLGVGGLKTSDVMDTPLWKKNAEGCRLDIRDYFEAMLAYIPYFFEDGMPMNVTLSQIIVLKKDSTDYFAVPEKLDGTQEALSCHLCAAARYAVYLTPDGRLLPCMPMTGCEDLQDTFSKVTDTGLRYGLTESTFMRFVDSRVRDLAERNRKCASCRYLFSCGGGCRAEAYAAPGAEIMAQEAFFGSDLNQCILFQEGYVERIHSITDKAISRYHRK